MGRSERNACPALECAPLSSHNDIERHPPLLKAGQHTGFQFFSAD